eukprot:8953945-Pyramimonas_sp.AAC.1
MAPSVAGGRRKKKKLPGDLRGSVARPDDDGAEARDDRAEDRSRSSRCGSDGEENHDMDPTGWDDHIK